MQNILTSFVIIYDMTSHVAVINRKQRLQSRGVVLTFKCQMVMLLPTMFTHIVGASRKTANSRNSWSVIWSKSPQHQSWFKKSVSISSFMQKHKSQKPPEVNLTEFLSNFAVSIKHFWCNTSKCALEKDDWNAPTAVLVTVSHLSCALFQSCRNTLAATLINTLL